MESQDQQLHRVHQKHWKEYQALRRLSQRGNASMLTCQGKSQKKGLWTPQNWVSKREGLSTHCRNNETSFNTHRAWGIHSGRRRTMEKRALYLKHKKKKKNWTAHRAISLGGMLDLCTVIYWKWQTASVHCLKQIVLRGANGQNTLVRNNIATDWVFQAWLIGLHFCTCCTLLYGRQHLFIHAVPHKKHLS